MERKIIGVGFTAEVYEYSKDTVLKLFKENTDIFLINKEFEMSKLAFENNVPTPEPKEIIHENNRIGIIYQIINGETVSKIQNEQNIWKILPKMVELQYKINKIECINNIYNYKNLLEYLITENNNLTEDEKEIMRKIINIIPEGNNLVHGDFHLENVIYCNNEYYIIDWGLGMRGTMAYDVAKTIMYMKDIEYQKNVPFLKKMKDRIFRKKLTKRYIKEYCKMSGMERNELKIWEIPLCIERLHLKYNKKEKERILKLLKKGVIKMQTCV